MKRRSIILAALLMAIMFAMLPAWGAQKPNIILIMADDIAYDNIGCYGSEYFKSPRLNTLADKQKQQLQDLRQASGKLTQECRGKQLDVLTDEQKAKLEPPRKK